MPSEADVVVCEGGCACGACKVVTSTQPFAILTCHCSNCRRVAGRDSCTISLFWCPAVHAKGPLQYTSTVGWFGLAGIHRSHCEHCQDYGICNFGTRAFWGMVFVSSDKLKKHPPSSSSSGDIFFNNGTISYSASELQKRHVVYSDVGSILYCCYIVVTRALPGLVALGCTMAIRKLGIGSKKNTSNSSSKYD